MDNFVVENLGPIAKADVTFGDLTILTGPQASGKTLFLETFALSYDPYTIATEYLISNESIILNDFLDFFFGDSMHSVIHEDTKFYLNSEVIRLSHLFNNLPITQTSLIVKSLINNMWPILYYIPAQRSLALSEGRIKTPGDFINSPYVLVQFSNYLQQYVRNNSAEILKETVNDYELLKNTEINMRRNAGSPRLEMTIDKQVIPYMAWSTGQRELTPMLMVLDYCNGMFKTASKENPNEKRTKYIVIEEPELGLHPRAIIEFMFTVLKLMNSGVKVIISTHSSTPLDFVWTMNRLKHKGVKSFAALAEMFDFKIKDKDFFDGLFEKEVKVYYFAPDPKTRKVHSKDISSLDVESEDEDVSNWGGMSLSADRAGSIVSKF